MIRYIYRRDLCCIPPHPDLNSFESENSSLSNDRRPFVVVMATGSTVRYKNELLNWKKENLEASEGFSSNFFCGSSWDSFAMKVQCQVTESHLTWRAIFQFWSRQTKSFVSFNLVPGQFPFVLMQDVQVTTTTFRLYFFWLSNFIIFT